MRVTIWLTHPSNFSGFSRHKFGSLGPAKVQFNSPHGFCMGFEEDIVVADTNNHRIQVFDKSGEFKYQFGVPGKAISSNNSVITRIVISSV